MVVGFVLSKIAVQVCLLALESGPRVTSRTRMCAPNRLVQLFPPAPERSSKGAGVSRVQATRAGMKVVGLKCLGNSSESKDMWLLGTSGSLSLLRTKERLEAIRVL